MSTTMTVGYRTVALKIKSMEAATTYLCNRDVAITCEPVDIGVTICPEITDSNGLAI